MSTQLFEAIAAGDLSVVRRILAESPETGRARNEQGVSAVMFALYRWQHAIAEALRPHAGPLDVFEAAAIGDAARISELLDGDATLLSAYAADGFTPLHFAAFFAREDAARVLVERGADVHAVTRNDMANQPLHAAAAGGSVEICRMLIERAADVNAQQQGGYAPLHEAAHRADIAMIDLFLAAGADKTATADDGKTPRDMAVEVGEGPAAEKLA
jgi:ankyrin repeat protein